MKAGFDEIWVRVGKHSMSALINGDQGWLMFIEDDGESNFSSRNPSYDGSPTAVIEYYLDNGQRDEYPAAWAYPIADVRRALEYFRREGARPPFIVWHPD